MSALELTVICVTYRSRELAPTALRSALASAESAGLTSELIVVDNASDDGTAAALAAAFPDATIVSNPLNVGFGAANNQAFEVARGRWWLMLNPDASIAEDGVAELIGAMAANPKLAIAAPSVAGAGMGGAESAGMLPGIRSLAGHFLFVNRLLPPGRGGAWRGFQVRPGVGNGLQDVEWVSAAAVLLRPEAVRAVGGFDPSIFLYGEDLDLCARLGSAGWRLAVLPRAHAFHSIGGSQDPASTRWLDGIDQFLVRRGVPRWRRAVDFGIVAIGLGLRAIASLGPGDEAHTTHRRRMRAGAMRAMAIASSGASAPASAPPSP
jgi:N-acetylglucosaminyl-diphospho-decaprenol L-rhamnosyltransferase